MKFGSDMGDLEGLGLPPGLGATGEGPGGPTTPDDQGQIKVALAMDRRNRRLVLAFGQPVAWVGMTGAEARAFALALLERANAI